MKKLPVFLASLLGFTGCSLDTLSQRSTPSPTPLFQADSLEGWETINGGDWTVVNGVFSGSKAADIDKHCLLVSTQEFADFELSLDYKAIHGNSGFYFRLAPENNGLGFKGYHAEIDATGKNVGGIYDVAVEWITKPEEELVAQAFKPGDWNTMKVSAKGKDIIVWLNGHKMSEIDFDRSAKGKLGFQLHAGENTQIQIKNLNITEL